MKRGKKKIKKKIIKFYGVFNMVNLLNITVGGLEKLFLVFFFLC